MQLSVEDFKNKIQVNPLAHDSNNRRLLSSVSNYVTCITFGFNQDAIKQTCEFKLLFVTVCMTQCMLC
jgi:hypothetical protein